MDEKALPQGRIARVARLAWLGARAGASTALDKVKRLRGGDGAEAANGDDTQPLAVAALTAETLGQLRGLALKVGQLASYVDGALPVADRERWEAALAMLRSAAPTMTEEACRRVLQEELGCAPETCFDSWEPKPFAAASIGQVHRAVLQGNRVAVKVQFEGIARAVESDLANASLLTGLMPLSNKLQAKGQFAELRARFLEELDYLGEARRQQRFTAIFAQSDTIRIPKVFAEHCTRRVLVSEFVEGLDFETACQAPLEERRAWAETLWRFVFESILGHGVFNADPHPGNYRFGPGGRVYFLDFGCVKELTAEQAAVVRANHRLVAARRFEEFVPRMLAMIGMRTSGVVADVSGEYILTAMRPIWEDGPFHITRDFAARLATEMATRQAELARKAPKEIEAPAPDWLFFNRLQLGFYSVLARLDVPVDYGAVHRSILAQYAD